nr:DUF4198 domain-containing protein [uncultured Methanoregula sp.]
MITKRIVLLTFLVILMVTGIASGHDTWTIPDSGRTIKGETVSLPVGSSHIWGTSEEIPEGYLIAVMADRDGNREAKTEGESAIAGFYRVFNFTIRNDGLYVFTLYHTEGTWTHIVTDPSDPEGGLWLNKKPEDIDISQLPTHDWSESWYIERSYPKHCYSKTFLASGNADFSEANLPVRTTWEIVPETDIRNAGTGDFAVKTLYKGDPFSDVVVTAALAGQEETLVENRTDSRGRALLSLNRSGTWIIKADTGIDPRIVSFMDLPKGPRASGKTPVGPLYRYTLVLRPDYTVPSPQIPGVA